MKPQITMCRPHGTTDHHCAVDIITARPVVLMPYRVYAQHALRTQTGHFSFMVSLSLMYYTQLRMSGSVWLSLTAFSISLSRLLVYWCLFKCAALSESLIWNCVSVGLWWKLKCITTHFWRFSFALYLVYLSRLHAVFTAQAPRGQTPAFGWGEKKERKGLDGRVSESCRELCKLSVRDYTEVSVRGASHCS